MGLPNYFKERGKDFRDGLRPSPLTLILANAMMINRKLNQEVLNIFHSGVMIYGRY
jgi:hypothetical protein